MNSVPNLERDGTFRTWTLNSHDIVEDGPVEICICFFLLLFVSSSHTKICTSCGHVVVSCLEFFGSHSE